MTALNKTTILAIGIYIVSGLLLAFSCHAESKSEMIKRLRDKSCQEDVGQTAAQLVQIQQFQADITRLLKSMESASLQMTVIKHVRSAETDLIALSAALSNHNHSKLTICERLNPGADSDNDDYPEGYNTLSKSDRINRIKVDYCTDNQQNGASIIREIIALKKTMKSMLNLPPPVAPMDTAIEQVQESWAQTVTIVDELHNEQVMASEICKNMAQGISKSELIRKSKQGLESGGQLPYFWYLITYD